MRTSPLRVLILITLPATLLLGLIARHELWAESRNSPQRTSKNHVEEISSSRHSYAIQALPRDGRGPLGVGMMDGPAIEQKWEANRAVRMENLGVTDVVNPWLSNGRNTFRTLDEIVASAVRPGMTDREKAYAIWFQEICHRYHWEGDNDELGDPVKVFNVYGYNTCGNDSICLGGLWKKAGLKVAPARVVGHCITQAFFDGRWNLFDGDMHSVYLLRDNQTVASEQDLVRDHDLIKRTHTQGILNPDRRANDEWEASIFEFEGSPEGTRNCKTGTNMNMVLRPREALVWRWGPTDPVKYHGGNKPKYPATICNGLWEYRPDFTKDVWKRGAVSVADVRVNDGALTAEAGKTGTIIWVMRSPYVFVGGNLEIEGKGATFSLSWDGKTWLPVEHNLDGFFSPKMPARYEYKLRCELVGDARLQSLKIVNDLQMAPLALPAVADGLNHFIYTDQTAGDKFVRITHDWIEWDALTPPRAPMAPVFPSNGGTSDGTDIVFRWETPAPQHGVPVVDYQFELSDRPDMLWPLSPNFYRLISKTADSGKAQYTLPHGGLLAPDRKYYWRVKSKDAMGIWGAWSDTWTFTSGGPAVPTNVTLDVNAERGAGTLRWQPNPIGRKPTAYRIYASDERGFTVHDEAAKTTVGISKDVPALQPANFVAEVAGTELAVIGADVRLANANRTFYRVVAVDEQGKRSGPSDYIEAPRPVVFSRPVAFAKVGSEYRYALACLRSLGDLRTHVVGGKETMNFWDIETPRFAIEQGPPWLKIDAGSGVLSGVPVGSGQFPVKVTATIERGTRKLDAALLSWGIEKVLSTDTKRVGVATQQFTINVAP